MGKVEFWNVLLMFPVLAAGTHVGPCSGILWIFNDPGEEVGEGDMP